MASAFGRQGLESEGDIPQSVQNPIDSAARPSKINS